MNDDSVPTHVRRACAEAAKSLISEIRTQYDKDPRSFDRPWLAELHPTGGSRVRQGDAVPVERYPGILVPVDHTTTEDDLYEQLISAWMAERETMDTYPVRDDN